MDDKRPIEKQEPGVVEIDDERQMREREGLAEAQAAQYDNDPNPYEGTYSEE